MLPGGRGIATSAASSLDSVDLLVLAVKMACNILRVECPVENGSSQQSLLKKTEMWKVDEILSLENVCIQIVMKKDGGIFQKTDAGSLQSPYNSEATNCLPFTGTLCWQLTE